MLLTSTYKFSTSIIVPRSATLQLLPRPLATPSTCEHAPTSCPIYDCFLVCVSTCNCKSTYDHVCECVLICIRGYEFPPVSKHVPTYKNPLKNDSITPKLHKSRCLSSSQWNNNLL